MSDISAGPPESDADGWPTARPDTMGLDAAHLEPLGAHFFNWSAANVHAVLMAKNGALVYEQYFSGPDRSWEKALGTVHFNRRTLHDVRSITKSIVSLLCGVAHSNGLLPDLDATVFELLPEYQDLATQGKDRITVRHLLTMSAGLAWNEDIPYHHEANSERQMAAAPDPIRYALSQPLIRDPGAAYTYNGGATAVLGAILERLAQRPLDRYAESAMLSPLGIDAYEWIRFSTGQPMAASGLRMRARDVAKIGQLVLGRGLWQGNKILPTAWIDDATAPSINGAGLYFYGYHWWLGRSLVRRKEVRWIAAVGYGGQRLYIVPDYDLVLVVLAGLYDDPELQNVVGDVVLRRYALSAAVE
ncbi:MAG: beta-lactamase family protein [Gammaproteobacteria bacterium]|nr:beta-lactamase family protein [Gammaproteobacteria bacterium]